MNTLISTLPPKLRALAEHNRNVDTDELVWSFIWSDSNEGNDFWENVDHATAEQLLQIESGL